MLLYSPGGRPPLVEYGILIPIAPRKASRIYEALVSDPVLGPHRARWHIQRDGTTMTRPDLLRVHSRRYVDRLYSDRLEEAIIATYELRDREGRPYRYDPSRATRPLTELLHFALENAGGTYQCCREALRHGFCFALSGGAHHAHRDFGHGFCLVNDSVLALRRLQAEGAVGKVWIIDVDAHKGDGTAALTAGDPSIVTLSVHMASGWPLDGPAVDPDGNTLPWFVPSDIDVPIESGQEDRYVPRLAAALEELDRRERPELALVLAGADPYEKDELPSTQLLRLTLAQMNERDRLIWRFLTDRGIPRAYLTSGGYGEHAWEVYPPLLKAALREELGLG